MELDRLFERLPEVLFASLRKRMLLGAVAAREVNSILEPLLADFYGIMPLLSPDLQTDLENILRIYPDVASRYSLRMKPPLETALPALAAHLWRKRRAEGRDEAQPPLAYAAERRDGAYTGPEPAVLAAEQQDDLDLGQGSTSERTAIGNAFGKRQDDLDSRPRSAAPAHEMGKSDGFGGARGMIAEEQMAYVGGENVLPEGQGFFKTGAGAGVYVEFSFLETEDVLLFGRKPVEMAVDIFLRESFLVSLPAGEPEKRVAAASFLEAFGEPSSGCAPSEVLIRVEEQGRGTG